MLYINYISIFFEKLIVEETYFEKQREPWKISTRILRRAQDIISSKMGIRWKEYSKNSKNLLKIKNTTAKRKKSFKLKIWKTKWQNFPGCREKIVKGKGR